NFEMLCKARDTGCKEVKVVLSDRCRCYRWLDGSYLKVPEALEAFYGKNVATPLLPPADSECGHYESPRICDIYLIPIEPPEASDYPEFDAWMKQILR